MLPDRTISLAASSQRLYPAVSSRSVRYRRSFIESVRFFSQKVRRDCVSFFLPARSFRRTAIAEIVRPEDPRDRGEFGLEDGMNGAIDREPSSRTSPTA